MATPVIAASIRMASGCWAPIFSVTVQAPSLQKVMIMVLMTVVGALAPSDVQGAWALR